MMYVFSLLLFLLPEYNLIVKQECFLVEFNHVYDGLGNWNYDQIIFWKVDKFNQVVDGRNQLVILDVRNIVDGREKLTEEEFECLKFEWENEWKVKHPNFPCPKYVPKWIGSNKFVPMKVGDYWMIAFYDNEFSCMRQIYFLEYYHTWTSYDVFKENRLVGVNMMPHYSLVMPEYLIREVYQIAN